MIELALGVLLGTLLGFILAPTKQDPADVDAAMERYRDAAVTFCESVLSGFGSTTQWDKFRQARKEYLNEAREED